jgi:hypothetical protein
LLITFMSERASEAVGPENGDDFLRKVSPTTQRERHPRRSRPSHSHRTPPFDAICNWSGQNTSSRSEDTKISARPSPHKYAAASTAEKWPLGINRSHPMGGPGRGTIVSTPVEEKEHLEWLRKTRNPLWHLRTCSWECDPPPLTQEEAEMHPPSRESPERWYSPLSNGEPSDSMDDYYSAMNSMHSSSCEEDSSETSEYCNGLEGYLAVEQEMLAQMNEEDLLEMVWQMTATTLERKTQFTRPAEAHNTADDESEVRSAGKNTRINNTCLWIWHGKAMQQTALLRRCFYPRRDVIKW